MKITKKKLSKNLIVGALAVAFVLGLVGSIKAIGTAVSLGNADSFAILAGTGITNTGTTTVTGDVGSYATTTQTGFGPGADSVAITGTNHFGDATTQLAKTALTAAYNNAGLEACDTDLSGQDLGGLVLTPGVYCFTSSAGLTGTVTLNGGGDPNAVFVFKIVSTLTTASGSIVSLTGSAQDCNVFWQVGSSATLGTNSIFRGNILALTSITATTGASITGRLLAQNGAVTLDTNTIAKAVCAVPTPTPTPTPTPIISSSRRHDNSITVVKQVVNDNGGTAAYADFPLFINGNFVTSGQSMELAPGLYTITETNLPNYKATFSGDCDASGLVNHGGINTQNDVCIITNNDIGAPVVVPPVPPLIDVVKVPTPLSLPDGPGPVTYTYTLRNTGTVPVANITMVGDTCSPIVLAYGDANGDSKLNVNETWVYICSVILSATRTNTVVATGWANGLSATDIASSTVVVGAPIVPPLVHVVKIPSRLTLPVSGGAVTYRYTVTNPGTAPLSNVTITDDKCTGLPGRVAGHPGDLNGNNLLESNETWNFTCQSNLTQTTVNTATASGQANGLVARDMALATVTVATAAPAFPNTGLIPDDKTTILNIVMAAGILLVASVWLAAVLRKQRSY